MLINIRGAFGAGKSTIAREALGKPNLGQNANRVVLAEQVIHSPTKRDENHTRIKRVVGTMGHFGRVCALGTYRAENPCGGVDEFSWKGAHDAICAAIEVSASMNRVTIFEGQVVSGIYQRYVDLAKRIFDNTRKHTYVIYVMPGRDECLRRVSERSGKDIDDPRLVSSVYDKYKAVENCFNRMASIPNHNNLGLIPKWYSTTDEAQEAVMQLLHSEGISV